MKGRKAAVERGRIPISQDRAPHSRLLASFSPWTRALKPVAVFASEGCVSKQWLGGYIQVCYRPAALIIFLSSYRGGKFPVHLIFYFALEHKTGKGLLYEICLTDS